MSALVAAQVFAILMQVLLVLVDVLLVLVAILAVFGQVFLVMVNVTLIGIAIRTILRQILLVVSDVFLVAFNVLLLRSGIRALGISAASEETSKSDCEHTSTDHDFCLHVFSPYEIVPGTTPHLQNQTHRALQSFGVSGTEF